MDSFKKIFSFLFLLTLSFSFFAQQHKDDSLRAVLKTEKNDTNKIDDMNTLSWDLANAGGNKEADSLARTALALSQKLNYKKGICKSYSNIGNVYWALSNFPEALAYFTKSLDIAREMGNKRLMANEYSHMGSILKLEGNYPEALKNELKSLQLYEEIGNESGASKLYNNIGNIYAAENDDSNAIKYHTKSYEMALKLNDKYGMAGALQNIGASYVEQRKYKEALEKFTEALKVLEEIGDKYDMGMLYSNIGAIYGEMKNFDEALQNQYKALQLVREVGDKSGLSSTYCSIADLFYNQEKFADARKYFDSALVIAKSINVKSELSKIYKDRAVLDKNTGDFKGAYEDYKNYIVYRDSLSNEADTRKMVQEQMQYDFDKKQAQEKAEQDKKDAVAETDKKKQRVISSFIAGGLILSLVFAGFVVRSLRITRKQKKVIEVKSREVEEKSKDILDSIHYAQRIQKALLASDNLLKQNLPDYFVFFKPKDIVSGDFYWAAKQNNRFYLAVCDSTGHGVPGAFMSLLNISYLNEAISEKNITQPNEVFNHARKRLIDNISQDGQQDGMDGILASVYPSEGGTRVDYAAAHNPPIVVRNGELTELAADKIPVGKSPLENTPFTHNSFKAEKGDTLYLFTDGYADQFGGAKGKKFKYQQLKDKLSVLSSQPMAEQKRVLEETLNNWKGNLEQVDDILIIGIRV